MYDACQRNSTTKTNTGNNCQAEPRQSHHEVQTASETIFMVKKISQIHKVIINNFMKLEVYFCFAF